MRLLTFPFEELPLEAAIDRSRGAFVLAQLALEKTDVPLAVLGVTAIQPGPAIVLGAMQHAARVAPGAFDAATKISVVRRTTSGTGFCLDGGMLFTMALSTADAAFADATARNMINRCVRPLLAGFARAGLSATYLGREWIAHQRHALAVLGVDLSPRGSILIEAWLTEKGQLSIPRSVASSLEASCDRYRGRPQRSLEEVAAGLSREQIAQRFIEGAADRLGGLPQLVNDMPAADVAALRVTRPDDPLPADFTLLPPIEIPIGFLDVARTSAGSSWVGGDMLAPTYALGFEPPVDVSVLPMEGAQWDNVRRARDATHQCP